jgi:hypothetical protein
VAVNVARVRHDLNRLVHRGLGVAAFTGQAARVLPGPCRSTVSAC